MSYRPPDIELAPPENEAPESRRKGTKPSHKRQEAGGKGKRPGSKDRGRTPSRDRQRSKERRSSKETRSSSKQDRPRSKERRNGDRSDRKPKNRNKSGSKDGGNDKKPRPTHGTSRSKPNPNPKKMHRKLQMAKVESSKSPQEDKKLKKREYGQTTIVDGKENESKEDKLAKPRASLLGNLGKTIAAITLKRTDSNLEKEKQIERVESMEESNTNTIPKGAYKDESDEDDEDRIQIDGDIFEFFNVEEDEDDGSQKRKSKKKKGKKGRDNDYNQSSRARGGSEIEKRVLTRSNTSDNLAAGLERQPSDQIDPSIGENGDASRAQTDLSDLQMSLMSQSHDPERVSFKKNRKVNFGETIPEDENENDGGSNNNRKRASHKRTGSLMKALTQLPKLPKLAAAGSAQVPQKEKKNNSKMGKNRSATRRTGRSRPKQNANNSLSPMVNERGSMDRSATPRTPAEIKDEARKIKIEWKKIREEKLAMDRQRKKMHKEQEKLKRDRNELQIDIRSFNLNKDKKSGKSYANKYAQLEEDKLRKQLYSEQQGWQEERMLFREQIAQLEGENAKLKRDLSRASQRQQVLQQQYQAELASSQLKPDMVKQFFSGSDNSEIELNKYASKQQREIARLIRLEKQRALEQVSLERQRLKMLEKQLNAQLIRLKQERLDFNKSQNRYRGGRGPRANEGVREIKDTRVVKKYVGRNNYRPKGDGQAPPQREKYKPVQTRIVYRDMRKNVIIKDEAIDRQIKYLQAKQRDLRGVKVKIVELEKKIDKDRAAKRAMKRKERKKAKKKHKRDASEVVVKATMPLRFTDDAYIRIYAARDQWRDSDGDWLYDMLKHTKFTDIDEDEGGTLNREEFHRYFDKMGVNPAITDHVFDEIDTAKDGEISVMEWLRWQRKFDKDKLNKWLDEIFRNYFEEDKAWLYEMIKYTKYDDLKDDEMREDNPSWALEHEMLQVKPEFEEFWTKLNGIHPKIVDFILEEMSTDNPAEITKDEWIEFQTQRFTLPMLQKWLQEIFGPMIDREVLDDNEMAYLLLGNDLDDDDEKDDSKDDSDVDIDDDDLKDAVNDLENLKMEYQAIEQEIDHIVLMMHSDDLQEKLDLLDQLLKERENGGMVIHQNTALKKGDDDDPSAAWENELLIVEKKLHAQHAQANEEFLEQLHQIEKISEQRHEENDAYKELNEDLTQKLAQSELEISNLKEIIISVNRKQSLRDLYMKMAYSKIPLKKTVEEAKADHEKLRNVLGFDVLDIRGGTSTLYDRQSTNRSKHHSRANTQATGLSDDESKEEAKDNLDSPRSDVFSPTLIVNSPQVSSLTPNDINPHLKILFSSNKEHMSINDMKKLNESLSTLVKYCEKPENHEPLLEAGVMEGLMTLLNYKSDNLDKISYNGKNPESTLLISCINALASLIGNEGGAAKEFDSRNGMKIFGNIFEKLDHNGDCIDILSAIMNGYAKLSQHEFGRELLFNHNVLFTQGQYICSQCSDAIDQYELAAASVGKIMENIPFDNNEVFNRYKNIDINDPQSDLKIIQMLRTLLENYCVDKRYVGIMSSVTQAIAHVSGTDDGIGLVIGMNWLPYAMDKLVIFQNLNDNSALNGYQSVFDNLALSNQSSMYNAVDGAIRKYPNYRSSGFIGLLKDGMLNRYSECEPIVTSVMIGLSKLSSNSVENQTVIAKSGILNECCNVLRKVPPNEWDSAIVHFGRTISNLPDNEETELAILPSLVDNGLCNLCLHRSFGDLNDSEGIDNAFGLLRDCAEKLAMNKDANNADNNVLKDEILLPNMFRIVKAIHKSGVNNKMRELQQIFDTVHEMLKCIKTANVLQYQDVLSEFKHKGLENDLNKIMRGRRKMDRTMNIIKEFYDGLLLENMNLDYAKVVRAFNEINQALYPEDINFENMLIKHMKQEENANSDDPNLKNKKAESKDLRDVRDHYTKGMYIKAYEDIRDIRSFHPSMKQIGDWLSKPKTSAKNKQYASQFKSVVNEMKVRNSQQFTQAPAMLLAQKDSKNKKGAKSGLSLDTNAKSIDRPSTTPVNRPTSKRLLGALKNMVTPRTPQSTRKKSGRTPLGDSTQMGQHTRTLTYAKNDTMALLTKRQNITLYRNFNLNIETLPEQPNRLTQQDRLGQLKVKKSEYPSYHDFLHLAVAQEISRKPKEIEQVYNEMTYHCGLVRPMGSMMQKWYVLANHSETFWISPTNEELTYYDENEEEYRYHDCWILYDLQRNRLVKEIRLRGRGESNDPKYVKVQMSDEYDSGPWYTVSNVLLSNTDEEQTIALKKRSRFWRVMFLGNYGENETAAPRYVFYEVQFWGSNRKRLRPRSRGGSAKRRRARSPGGSSYYEEDSQMSSRYTHDRDISMDSSIAPESVRQHYGGVYHGRDESVYSEYSDGQGLGGGDDANARRDKYGNYVQRTQPPLGAIGSNSTTQDGNRSYGGSYKHRKGARSASSVQSNSNASSKFVSKPDMFHEYLDDDQLGLMEAPRKKSRQAPTKFNYKRGPNRDFHD